MMEREPIMYLDIGKFMIAGVGCRQLFAMYYEVPDNNKVVKVATVNHIDLCAIV